MLRGIKFAFILLALSVPLHADMVKDQNFKITGLKDEVQIGGPKDGAAMFPEIRTSFKMGTSEEQFFLSIKRIGATKTVPAYNLSKVIFNDGAVIDDFSTFGTTLQWNVTYSADPRGGGKGDYVARWSIQTSPEIYFAYQPPLTQKEIDDGNTYRPDNVVGSYAIFIQGRNNLVDARGNSIINFGSGKLGHIYRPFVSDFKGDKIWGILDISNKGMTVTIPAAFLDAATFPVTLDPDFGYTTLGASEGSNGQQMIVQGATTTSRGTFTSMSVGFRNSTHGAGNQLLDYCIYTLKNKLFLANATYDFGKAATTVPSLYDGFLQFPFYITPKPNLLPEPLGYWLAILPVGALWVAYDTDTATGSPYKSIFTQTFESPPTFDGDQGQRRYSIYATYTLRRSTLRSVKRRFFMRRAP
jgi:hypothetical protein